MPTEPVPAIVLLNLRRQAQRAKRLGQHLDPQAVLDTIAGKGRA